ncbi:membrane protein [Amycolatopsis ultiminotia]|uniref:Membrane protein n=1 Tax=Amycolatopsis ultiminotia TaxID=543629 RepID=A0ABP6VY83_9PSEU
MPPYPGGGGYGGPGGGWTPHGLGKPGVIALRPLNVSDILDGAITAIRRYPLLILGLSAIVAVVVAGLNLLLSLLVVPDLDRVSQLGPAATRQEQLDAVYSLLGSTLTSLLPTLVITLLGQTFLTGFLTVVMGKAVLGRPVDFGSAMREVAPRLLPLLALTILYALATMVAAVFCLLPAVLPYVFWSLAGPALVLERGSIRQAFSRSGRLVAGTFWRVLGILLLAAIIGWLISAIIGIPFNIGSGAFSGLFNPQPTVPQVSTGGLVLQSVGTVISSTIVTPFTALVTVLLYIDQRMRREGMDIELARAAGINPPRQAW